MTSLKITWVYEPQVGAEHPTAMGLDHFAPFVEQVGRYASVTIPRTDGRLCDVAPDDGFILLKTSSTHRSLTECSDERRADLASRIVPLGVSQTRVFENLLEPLSIPAAVDSMTHFEWTGSAPDALGADGLLGLKAIGAQIGANCPFLSSERYCYLSSKTHHGLPHLLADYLAALHAARQQAGSGRSPLEGVSPDGAPTSISAPRPAKRRPPIKLLRKPFQLSPTQLTRLREAAERDAHAFVDRLSGPIDVHEITQPWLRRHRVLEIGSAAPFPARALFVVVNDREIRVLNARLENLQRAAAEDPPLRMEREDNAADYAAYGHAWTTPAAMGELRIESFDEIPWHARLDDKSRQQIDELRARFGDAIRPEERKQTSEGWHFRSWWIATRQLIERELIVEANGQLRRIDQVHAEYLPLPPGRHWKLVDGRLIPAG